jgi:hypothetical protein
MEQCTKLASFPFAGVHARIKTLSRQGEDILKFSISPPKISGLLGPITCILNSVQWPMLKSLELSGDQIDEWIELWKTPNNHLTATASDVGPSLLHLHIQGSKPQLASHSSMLFIHKFVHSSSLVELHLENLQLQDPRN